MEMFVWDHLDWHTKLEGICDLALTLQTQSISQNIPVRFQAIAMKPSS